MYINDQFAPNFILKHAKMPEYTEADISSAINAVLNGVSLRKAACDYGIPRQTLSNRILGAQANS